MKLQERKLLSSIYTREEDFSADLADNLDTLNVGEFEDVVETEFNVNRRTESDYLYEYNDSPKQIRVKFPVLDKGKNNQDDWDEIREALVTMGTDIYNKINESDL